MPSSYLTSASTTHQNFQHMLKFMKNIAEYLHMLQHSLYLPSVVHKPIQYPHNCWLLRQRPSKSREAMFHWTRIISESDLENRIPAEFHLKTPSADSWNSIWDISPYYNSLSSDMNSLLCTGTKSTRAFRSPPVLKRLLRRGVSTQELDASKGGKSAHILYLTFF